MSELSNRRNIQSIPALELQHPLAAYTSHVKDVSRGAFLITRHEAHVDELHKHVDGRDPMMINQNIRQRVRELAELIQEMGDIVDEDAPDSLWAFFEACEDAQYQVVQMMRAVFLETFRDIESSIAE